MPTFLFLIALVSACLLMISLAELALGSRKLDYLAEVNDQEITAWPSVALVIPARNEARHLEEALASVLALDYAPLEIRVINDRSTDATGPILAAMRLRSPQLQVTEVTELPHDWLGKNNALQAGAAASNAEWCLFCDADIVMRPDTLRRAMAYALRHQLDHLTIAPDLRLHGLLLNILATGFGLFFTLYSKPWKARRPSSRAAVGIGAFNLVRRNAYFSAGGHAPIALRPDDDMMLGKLLKQNGCRQDFLIGRGLLHVEWYHSVREMIDGLMKNAFAGVDYRISRVLLASLFLLALMVWPLIAIWLTHGLTFWLNLTMIGIILFMGVTTAYYTGSQVAFGLGLPLAALLFAYILWRSTFLTLWNGGITWRGTFYPLSALRRNRL